MRTNMPRHPEGRLVTQRKNGIERNAGVVYHSPGGDNFQEMGIPDLLCCFHGMFVGIEVKQPGEKPSKAQLYQLDKIRRAGGIAVVIDDIDDLKLALMEPAGEKTRRG